MSISGFFLISNKTKNGRMVKMKKRKKVLVLFILVLLFFSIYFGFLHLKIREHSLLVAPENVDYLIVLGARVKGTTPSLSLQYRIDAAAKYLKENQTTIAIASGGKGDGEDISEAEAIKNGLIVQGIGEGRIILEDKSTDTVENISFSMKLIPNHLKTGLVVSNDFHIYRAKLIAKDLGLQLAGLPADTPTIAIPKSYSREYLAITKYFIKRSSKMN
jgi:uncharacterized SAM-binding protein YcdF (DUF218 family)